MSRRSPASRPFAAALLSVLLALLTAACGTGDPGIPGGTPTAPTGGGPGATPAGPGSGAQARIVNLHVPAKGEPGPVDVYLKPFALEGDKPAFSVPYGEIGAFFDPDPDGDTNVFLSVYRPGETGNGNSIMSWTETVAKGDTMTFVLSTGENLDADGNRFGQLQTFDHVVTGDVPRPTAGSALLMVNTVALENVTSDMDDYYMLVSAGGSGCANAFYDTDGGRGLLGRQLDYLLPPGSTAISFHRYPSDGSGGDCSETPFLADVPVTLAADERVLLLLYAPKADDYRTLLVPLEP